MLHPQKTKIIRAILSRLPQVSKEEAVLEHTSLRTTHITEMTATEADALIASLRRLQEQRGAVLPSNRMRRNIIAMAHEMRWELPNGKADMQRIDGWCCKYGYLHKPLNDYKVQELPTLVTQLKKVYETLLKAI